VHVTNKVIDSQMDVRRGRYRDLSGFKWTTELTAQLIKTIAESPCCRATLFHTQNGVEPRNKWECQLELATSVLSHTKWWNDLITSGGIVKTERGEPHTVPSNFSGSNPVKIQLARYVLAFGTSSGSSDQVSLRSKAATALEYIPAKYTTPDDLTGSSLEYWGR
jgi:hypothetical protein